MATYHFPDAAIPALVATGRQPALEASGGWVQQLARLRRWERRILEHEIRNSELYPDEQDDVVAFFVTCTRLQDWVKGAAPLQTEALKKLVEQHDSLRAAQDITDRSKHLFLHPNHADTGWQWLREYVPPTNRENRTERWLVFHGTRAWGMNDLVQACVRDWHQVLVALGLGVPDLER